MTEKHSGWEVLVTSYGHDKDNKQQPQDLTTTRMFVVAPDLNRAEEAALRHAKTMPAAEGIVVTDTRVDRVTRIMDPVLIWKAVVH